MGPLGLTQQPDLLRYADPMIGTQRMGHVYPGATAPFGMVQVGPDTDTLPYAVNGTYDPAVYRTCSGYQYDDSTIVGFSHTHFSGTGHSDLGDVLLMPATGPLQLDPGTADAPERGFRSVYHHRHEHAAPGYYGVQLEDDHIRAELNATPRVGLHRYTFPRVDSAHVVLDLVHSIDGNADKNVWTFVRMENDTLVKVALSSVSTEGAVRNMQAEVPRWDFDGVMRATQDAWRRELGRITITSDRPDVLTDLYTAMYHACLSPTLYMDVDGRYRGLDQNVHTAEGFTNYTTFSLWDTYRALHPLFDLVQRERSADMINSMLAHYDQSVHHMLPVWSCQANETGCMIGYHGVSVIADTQAKGITGFDAEHALDACVQSARNGWYGGLDTYMRLGYVPEGLFGIFSIEKITACA